MGALSALSAASGMVVKTQKFESSGVWNVPEGVETVFVTMCGGGGGGAAGGDSSYNYAAAGGAGGHILDTPVDVSGQLSATITIGAAGVYASNTGSATATSGGSSTLTCGATTVSAYGGGGAYIASGNYSVGGAGGYPGGSGGAAYAGVSGKTALGGGVGVAGRLLHSSRRNSERYGLSSSMAASGRGPLGGQCGDLSYIGGGTSPIEGYGSGGGSRIGNTSEGNGTPQQGVCILTWLEPA